MSMASLEVIRSSSDDLYAGWKHGGAPPALLRGDPARKPRAQLSAMRRAAALRVSAPPGEFPGLAVGPLSYTILIGGTLAKGVLYGYCKKASDLSDSIAALAEDHLNDGAARSRPACRFQQAVSAPQLGRQYVAPRSPSLRSPGNAAAVFSNSVAIITMTVAATVRKLWCGSSPAMAPPSRALRQPPTPRDPFLKLANRVLTLTLPALTGGAIPWAPT